MSKLLVHLRRECNNADLLSPNINVVGSCIYVCHRSSGAKLNMPPVHGPALIDIAEEDFLCVCMFVFVFVFVYVYVFVWLCASMH